MIPWLAFPARVVAFIIAIGLIGAMLFGFDTKATWIGLNQTLRQVAVAAWCVGLPAWFLIEDALFAPQGDPKKLAEFHDGQRRANIAWAAFGGFIVQSLVFSSPINSLPPRLPRRLLLLRELLANELLSGFATARLLVRIPAVPT
jgi:hypothetical protein